MAIRYTRIKQTRAELRMFGGHFDEYLFVDTEHSSWDLYVTILSRLELLRSKYAQEWGTPWHNVKFRFLTDYRIALGVWMYKWKGNPEVPTSPDKSIIIALIRENDIDSLRIRVLESGGRLFKELVNELCAGETGSTDMLTDK